MTADARDHTEALAEVLAAHWPTSKPGAFTTHHCRRCDFDFEEVDEWATHVAAALLASPAFADLLAAEQRGRAAGFKSGVRAGYRAAQEAEGHPAPDLTQPGITAAELMSRVDRGIERIKQERERAAREEAADE